MSVWFPGSLYIWLPKGGIICLLNFNKSVQLQGAKAQMTIFDTCQSCQCRLFIADLTLLLNLISTRQVCCRFRDPIDFRDFQNLIETSMINHFRIDC